MSGSIWRSSSRQMGPYVSWPADGETIVGASTASPMAETDEEFIEPFKTDGYDIAKVFYLRVNPF